MQQAILRPSLRHGSGQDWTNPSKCSGHVFLNRPEASDIQRTCGPICPWELLLFNTPINEDTHEKDNYFLSGPLTACVVVLSRPANRGASLRGDWRPEQQP
jgi:hypothetical protein